MHNNGRANQYCISQKLATYTLHNIPQTKRKIASLNINIDNDQCWLIECHVLGTILELILFLFPLNNFMRLSTVFILCIFLFI